MDNTSGLTGQFANWRPGKRPSYQKTPVHPLRCSSEASNPLSCGETLNEANEQRHGARIASCVWVMGNNVMR